MQYASTVWRFHCFMTCYPRFRKTSLLRAMVHLKPCSTIAAARPTRSGACCCNSSAATKPDLLQQSDAICTGLQLANFWQDIAIDWRKGRVYLPQHDLLAFDVTEAQIARGGTDANWRRLMAFEVERTRALLQRGAPLARALGGRIGIELRLVVQGGLRILERIDAVAGDVFSHRPTLTARDWTLMGWRALQPLPSAA